MSFRALVVAAVFALAFATVGHAQGNPGFFPEYHSEVDMYCRDVVHEKYKGKYPESEILTKLGPYNSWTDCIDDLKPTWRRPDTKKFDIDGLKIEVMSLPHPYTAPCHSGGLNTVKLSGPIGEDSSFAIETVLSGFEVCRDEEGSLISPITIEMDSGGGSLAHGYKLGRLLRAYEVRTVVADYSECASACAVAFLGGVFREVERGGKLLFHAPYVLRSDRLGQYPSCFVAKEVLSDLKSYYVEMTGSEESGLRLYDRTMLDCSTTTGWVLTGHDSAELFGIATKVTRSSLIFGDSPSAYFLQAKKRSSHFYAR